MIRKIFKWIGIVLGSLIGLLVLAFVVLYSIGSVKWNKFHGKYDVPVETITVPTDQASIARGEHVAVTHMCGDCHTDTLSGRSDSAPGLITLTIPNLTAGAGGVGATNSDEDWVRAIRHGVGYDGRGLVRRGLHHSASYRRDAKWTSSHIGTNSRRRTPPPAPRSA
ncbi:MAG TPA: hypothetical protein VN653_05665 [Anaerolineales bacterium]|nr:hypothetical protein [Anaerolineales bacterium]